MTTIDNWGQCPFHSSILEVNTKWIPNMTSPCSEMQVLLRWKCGWIKLKSYVGKQTLGALFLDRCQIPLKIIFLEIIKKYFRRMHLCVKSLWQHCSLKGHFFFLNQGYIKSYYHYILPKKVQCPIWLPYREIQQVQKSHRDSCLKMRFCW